ncbi:MAG: hypothetical protein DDT42_02069 [candidate division WS2 bacterium]|uniref:Uncharacterized protein n=1 Tax=Psychracetigena formicireducens TaxID=2986056 RepID=A0A9E2F2U9_PSYF1|nr:hypothetical protein [Candidatus Psychracetigena formicireducens]
MENNGKYKVEIEREGAKIMETNDIAVEIEVLEADVLEEVVKEEADVLEEVVKELKEIKAAIDNLERKFEFVCVLNGLIGGR